MRHIVFIYALLFPLIATAAQDADSSRSAAASATRAAPPSQDEQGSHKADHGFYASLGVQGTGTLLSAGYRNKSGVTLFGQMTLGDTWTTTHYTKFGIGLMYEFRSGVLGCRPFVETAIGSDLKGDGSAGTAPETIAASIYTYTSTGLLWNLGSQTRMFAGVSYAYLATPNPNTWLYPSAEDRKTEQAASVYLGVALIVP